MKNTPEFYNVHPKTKMEIWIENNKKIYYTILISLGFLLGVGGVSILGGATRQGVLMGFVYSFIFILTDSVGGDI